MDNNPVDHLQFASMDNNPVDRAVTRVDTFDELMTSSSENSPMKPLSIEDSFNPHGLKVLVVDNDRESLSHLTEMLTSCQYQATTCSLPTEALQLIKDDNNKFDIVITEVHFSPDINGIEFLEIIDRETELPVAIVSTDESIDTITECIMKGACICISKPANKEVIQFLWQHVARRHHKMMKAIDVLETNEPSSSNTAEDKEFCGSSGSDNVEMDDDQTKYQVKKNRMVWTDDLHAQFVDAVKQLGIQNAVPKKVLELMNVPGLRRENVASHLQAYRKNLQMLSTNMQPFPEQSSVSSDAYIPVLKNNDSFRSTLPITKVQQEQDSITEVPGGANSQVMGSDKLFIRSSPINDELQHHSTVVDSSIQLVPNGAYHPMIENNWIVESPLITDDELKTTLQQFEFDDPLSPFHDLDYGGNI